MSRREDPDKTPFTRTEAVWAGRWIIWSVIAAVCCGIAAVVLYSFYPALLGIEHDAFKASHQYIENGKTAIYTYYDGYTELSTKIAELEDKDGDYTKQIAGMQAQQKAMLLQMRNEARSLPADEVPPEISSLLNPTQ